MEGRGICTRPIRPAMPELPDITVYIEALEKRVLGERLQRLRVNSPFLIRTLEPSAEAFAEKTVRQLRRLGKRIAIGLDDQLWIVLHLMIAGRLHWKEAGAKLAGKYNLAAFDFSTGTLVLTEAGSKRRAALHLVQGDDALAGHDPGGIDVFSATPEEFGSVLRRQNHTLKRVLTDPALFSGTGVFRRDSVPGAAIAVGPLAENILGRDRATAHGHAGRAVRVDRSAARAGGQCFPRERDRVPARDGGPWAIRQTVPGLRRTSATDSLCGQRDELLPRLPDSRANPGRSLAVAALERRLAAAPR